MVDWVPSIADSDKPRYMAIAEAIGDDIGSGRLVQGDRLPPQRRLAEQLGIDFTTVARGYVEAQKRGLIESRVGRGSFVTGHQKPASNRAPRSVIADLAMNLPPEPDDPVLIERMRAGLEDVSRDLVTLLRYQPFGGAPADKDAASSWLGRRALVPSQERLFVAPGAHAALTSILSVIVPPGQTIVCEPITYPGVRAIAAQLGLNLVGLEMDDDGLLPDSFAECCRRLGPRALYVNPTLQNPISLTIPERRRTEIAAIARRYGVAIVEDDAYGFIPRHGPHPFAAIAPDLTWHVAGLAKCIGAGLRSAYVVVPNVKSGWPFVAAMRAANVMTSPLMAALATRWIEDGTADAILAFIREEAAARQAIASRILPAGCAKGDPLSFCLWVKLPEPWTRSAFVGHMRTTGLGVVASDAFAVEGQPPEAVRVCLGGPIARARLEHGLEFMAHTLAQSPVTASSFL